MKKMFQKPSFSRPRGVLARCIHMSVARPGLFSLSPQGVKKQPRRILKTDRPVIGYVCNIFLFYRSGICTQAVYVLPNSVFVPCLWPVHTQLGAYFGNLLNWGAI